MEQLLKEYGEWMGLILFGGFLIWGLQLITLL